VNVIERELNRYRAELEKYRQANIKVIQPITQFNYEHYIALFLEWVEKYREGIRRLVQRAAIERRDVLPEVIDEWLFTHPEWSHGTKQIAAFAVLSYLHWVHRFKINYKAIKHIATRPEHFDPYIYTDEQIEQIFFWSEVLGNKEALKTLADDPIGRHFKRVNLNLYVGVRVGWDTLARASEVCSITLQDIDLDNRLVFIHAKKGSRPAWAKITEESAQRIEDVIRYRQNYLLEGKKGKPVSPTSWSVQFHRFCKKLFGRPPEKVRYWRWHDFSRHSHVVKLFDQGYSMDDIQMLARHRKRSSTEIYLHLEPVRRRVLMVGNE